MLAEERLRGRSGGRQERGRCRGRAAPVDHRRLHAPSFRCPFRATRSRSAPARPGRRRDGSGARASGPRSDSRTGSRRERPRKTNRGSLPAHLERIEQVVDVEDKACPCCGGALHQIGEDVAERLDVVPTTFRVLVTRRPRYGCRSCESAVVQAPAPARIVEGGIPTEALIAQVLVAKYADHLPLYRQAQIYARQGIQLDRSTLADWVGRAAWYLRPLRDHVLESCDDPNGCSPTRPPRPCSIRDAGGRRPASYGPMPAMIGHGAATIRRWSPMSTPPTARRSGPRRISGTLPASCRSMAMAATPRSPGVGSR